MFTQKVKDGKENLSFYTASETHFEYKTSVYNTWDV